MHKCLVVIDYQNDFIDGSLGFKKAQALAQGIKELIDLYHKNNDDVVFTLDSHDANYLNTQEGKMLPVKHCTIGSEGHKLHPLIEASLNVNDKIYNKSTFGSLILANDFATKNYDYIEIVGLVTNICVIANAILIKSALPEASVVVRKNLCASFDDNLHIQALEIMQGLQIIVQ